MLLWGSNGNIPWHYNAEEEEYDWCLLLELALLTSFSWTDRGLTVSYSEWDLVCLKGDSLA